MPEEGVPGRGGRWTQESRVGESLGREREADLSRESGGGVPGAGA